MFDVSIVIGIGNSSAISTSEIMKIKKIKKNRDEKGSRAEFFGQHVMDWCVLCTHQSMISCHTHYNTGMLMFCSDFS
jgi:hypothetical protein